MKRQPAPLAMSPYGDFDTMLGTIVERLANSPYLLGDSLSAADILWIPRLSQPALAAAKRLTAASRFNEPTDSAQKVSP